jgi:monothiol glutaredoxin
VSQRETLPQSRVAPKALDQVTSFHSATVTEVIHAVDTRDVVVVGMAQNPHVKKVRKALDDAGITFTYLEYGSYVSQWKARLAIKMWSGWPTFPQVFVKGVLLGGEDRTLEALQDGSLRERLGQPRPS